MLESWKKLKSESYVSWEIPTVVFYINILNNGCNHFESVFYLPGFSRKKRNDNGQRLCEKVEEEGSSVYIYR